MIISCPSINGLFGVSQARLPAQSLRYAKKIILGISNRCLWLFFSHALILNNNPYLWMDTISFSMTLNFQFDIKDRGSVNRVKAFNINLVSFNFQ